MATLFVTCAMGFNVAVVQFGTVAQAYGLCLLMTEGAFHAAIAAVDRHRPMLSTLAGLLSAAMTQLMQRNC